MKQRLDHTQLRLHFFIAIALVMIVVNSALLTKARGSQKGAPNIGDEFLNGSAGQHYFRIESTDAFPAIQAKLDLLRQDFPNLAERMESTGRHQYFIPLDQKTLHELADSSDRRLNFGVVTTQDCRFNHGDCQFIPVCIQKFRSMSKKDKQVRISGIQSGPVVWIAEEFVKQHASKPMSMDRQFPRFLLHEMSLALFLKKEIPVDDQMRARMWRFDELIQNLRSDSKTFKSDRQALRKNISDMGFDFEN